MCIDGGDLADCDRLADRKVLTEDIVGKSEIRQCTKRTGIYVIHGCPSAKRTGPYLVPLPGLTTIEWFIDKEALQKLVEDIDASHGRLRDAMDKQMQEELDRAKEDIDE